MSNFEGVEISIKVVTDKDKTRVLFVEGDGNFADILLSFLVMPLGRVVKMLANDHVKENRPTIGCIGNIYNSMKALDCSCFCSRRVKESLTDPLSSFDEECAGLKLDICDYRPSYYSCHSICSLSLRKLSVYWDEPVCKCYKNMKLGAGEEQIQSDRLGKVFTLDDATFIVTDDLHIMPSTGTVAEMVTILGFGKPEGTAKQDVKLKHKDFVDLYIASLISETPLSEVILKKTGQEVKLGKIMLRAKNTESVPQESDKKQMILKMVINKSTKKLLFARGDKAIVDLLFSFLPISLGGVERLLAGKPFIKSIDHLYKSVHNARNKNYFKNSDIEKRLNRSSLAHGYLPKSYVLNLDEEKLPSDIEKYYVYYQLSKSFFYGQGKYLRGPKTYMIYDDLTIEPFYMADIFCNKEEVSPCDLEELNLTIGPEEALNLLQAALTTKHALTSGILNPHRDLDISVHE
ncbi:uncharacterized protein LOC125195630 [Salvia hispanica]|uniref:uncharacterized protein LOC125195630 n=1 Tax=Salvia hispanica TaxID=49212 RepID=UPI0020098CA8|nr:uncharacterized protein LOC125195630 [Salvia hispanica]